MYLSGDARDVVHVVEASDRLFRSIIERVLHVLRPICSPTVDRKFNVKPRPPDFVLPPKDDLPQVMYTIRSLHVGGAEQSSCSSWLTLSVTRYKYII